MISRAAREALAETLGDRVRFDFPMSRCTSLRVGGPADAFASPADRDELARLLGVCAGQRLPHTVLGAGFNTLVHDGGVDGVVIHLGRLRRLEERPGGALRAEAGVSHNQLVKFCLARGLAGLAYGAGIPGTLGGWVAMNAGVPEGDTGEVVQEIEVMSPTGQQRRHLGREKLCFRYRSLRGLAPGSVVLSALLRVTTVERARVEQEVARMLERRSRTQPLDVPSCGSVFVNPPGDYAGRLIETAGLKGRRLGGAQISPVHANFIANLGGATARDVTGLIELAQDGVARTHGVRLRPEVRIIGRKL